MATSTLGSGTLVLAGTTSGTTTVTATAVAGTTTLTLPAATDTLVGKATTDTLTNKTLTSPTISSPTITGTLSATGNVTTTQSTNGVLYFATANANAGGSADNQLIAGNGTNNAIVSMKGTGFTTSGIFTANNAYFGGTGTSTTNLYSTNGNVNIYPSSTLVGAFSSTGLAVTGLTDISAATSGQIKFPATQNASSNANTLDDYEEGTWTPAGLLGSAGTSSTSSVVATYTKVGRLVSVACSFNFTLGTGSGNFSVTGLPFAANSALVYTAISTGCENVGTLTKTIVGYVNPSNTNIILIFQPQDTGASVIVTSGEMAATSTIRISATYFSA
jgi:hypothetical protein